MTTLLRSAVPMIARGPVVTLGLIPLLLGALSCGEPPVASPTPEPGSLEFLEDQEWEGWLNYSDAIVRLHLYTTFELFSHRDGLFCGRYRGWWYSYGSYLEVNTGVEWITVFADDPNDDVEGGSEGRMYGTVNETFSLLGWLDLTTTGEVAEVDSSAVPEFSGGAEYFMGKLSPSDDLDFDTLPLTLGELIGYVSRESAEPMSAETLAMLPLSEVLDLPSYTLTLTGPSTDTAAEALYCQWCKEPGDDETPSPLR